MASTTQKNTLKENYQYLVIEFSDGTEVIPRNWVVQNKFAYCPKEQAKFYRLVEMRVLPAKEWKLYPIKRILGGAGKINFWFFPKNFINWWFFFFFPSETFKVAKERLDDCMYFSNISTGDEESQKKKRRLKSAKADKADEPDEPLDYTVPETVKSKTVNCPIPSYLGKSKAGREDGVNRSEPKPKKIFFAKGTNDKPTGKLLLKRSETKSTPSVEKPIEEMKKSTSTAVQPVQRAMNKQSTSVVDETTEQATNKAINSVEQRTKEATQLPQQLSINQDVMTLLQTISGACFKMVNLYYRHDEKLNAIIKKVDEIQFTANVRNESSEQPASPVFQFPLDERGEFETLEERLEDESFKSAIVSTVSLFQR